MKLTRISQFRVNLSRVGRTRIYFPLRAPTNNPITERAPILVPGFHSICGLLFNNNNNNNSNLYSCPAKIYNNKKRHARYAMRKTNNEENNAVT